MGIMARTEIAEEIARILEMPRKEARQVLEVILDSIVRALSKGERVELRGFGTFGTRVRGARKGRDPRSGTELDIQARRLAVFRPGKELLALVNGSMNGRPPVGNLGNGRHCLDENNRACRK